MIATRDFGGLVTRVPSRTFAVASVDELASVVAELAASNTPFVVRGTAHTAGGQTVTDGVVIETRGMRRIVEDRPECDELVVEAGALWLDVVRHLAPQGRRPTALTDNLRTTVGGTLALGGFGDTSHRHGMQVAGVSALTVITPEGKRVSCAIDDDLFRYSLPGRGQLGVIAEVTIRTLRRPPQLTARVLTWRSLDTFLGDARVLQRCEYLRARLQFGPDGAAQVVALAGDFGVEPLRPDPIHELRLVHASAVDTLDLRALAEVDPTIMWPRYAPCLELTFPIPHGLTIWKDLCAALHQLGLLRALPEGASIMVVAGDPRYPLAPLGVGDNLVVALRFGFDDEPTAQAVAAQLRAIGDAAIRAGARLYPITTSDEPIERLYEAAARWRVLKERIDPRRLCNPWQL